MKKIYLDNAATTPLDRVVLRSMEPFFLEQYGNPSSIYSLGVLAKNALAKARQDIAKSLNSRPSEIIFTAGGTESDNLAIQGIVKANKERGRHIITSKIEHPAVLHTCQKLEKDGFAVTYLDVNKNGLVNLEQLKKAISKETILVTIMYANNEIGTIQPVSEIAKIIRKYKSLNNTAPFFHTDACQAAGYLDLNVNKLGVDLLTLNGSKIYGPKGTGLLFIKNGVKIEPLIYGGGQESNLRSGTENVPGYVGLAKALSMASKKAKLESLRVTKLRDYFFKKVQNKIKSCQINGDLIHRLPNNINISIDGIEGEAMVLYLDSYGVMASTGSACSSNSLEPSHVLLALGLSHEQAHGSLRLTLGRKTTKDNLDYVLKVLPIIVGKLRNISAL